MGKVKDLMMGDDEAIRNVTYHDAYCPAIRPHISYLCQHPKGEQCGVCVHECLCDLLAIVRAEEALKNTNQRINDLREQLTGIRGKGQQS